MIDTQNRIRKIIPGFRFNMGFSGKYFNHGTEEENKGDIYLLGKLFFYLRDKLT